MMREFSDPGQVGALSKEYGMCGGEKEKCMWCVCGFPSPGF